MKEDTKETAVELLKEWQKLKMDIETDNRTLDNPTKFVVPNMEKADEISRRLDEMCEAAGISIQVGVEYTYGSFVYGHVFHGRAMDLEFSDPFRKYRPIPAREQQALQEWLLIKEGK
jgi:hypothetical protein